MYGIALSGALLGALTIILLMQLRADRRKPTTVPCPFCHGQGVIPVGHPNGDPQLDTDRECPDCAGEARLTTDEIDASTAADRIADRIERAIHASGFQTIVSHYPGMPPSQRWELGALLDGRVTAGPITGATRLTAMNALAHELGIDVRRIPS